MRTRMDLTCASLREREKEDREGGRKGVSHMLAYVLACVLVQGRTIVFFSHSFTPSKPTSFGLASKLLS